MKTSSTFKFGFILYQKDEAMVIYDESNISCVMDHVELFVQYEKSASETKLCDCLLCSSLFLQCAARFLRSLHASRRASSHLRSSQSQSDSDSNIQV